MFEILNVIGISKKNGKSSVHIKDYKGYKDCEQLPMHNARRFCRAAGFRSRVCGVRPTDLGVYEILNELCSIISGQGIRLYYNCRQ